MVIRNVVPRSLTRNAVRDIAAFVRADLTDNATWYGSPPQLDGVVPLHHAQSLWDIRQCPESLPDVQGVLWNSASPRGHEQVHFSAPSPSRLPGYRLRNDSLGYRPESFGAGIVAGRCTFDRRSPRWGGFQCIPEIYRNLEECLEQNAGRNDFDFFNPGLNHWKTTQVEGKAGDVILWSTKLPDGSAINLSDRPRIAAFVSMQPAADNTQIREPMRSWWLTKRAPDYWRGLPGQFDPEPGPPAVLSDLGLKLIGLAPWCRVLSREDGVEHFGRGDRVGFR
jgi:hypothetical protein